MEAKTNQSDSRDIPQHMLNERARKSVGHWADLRSGDMYQGDEPQLPHGAGIVIAIIAGAIFWLAVFVIWGLVT